MEVRIYEINGCKGCGDSGIVGWDNCILSFNLTLYGKYEKLA
jgi:hypothetical protein